MTLLRGDGPILLVDDDPDDRFITRASLKRTSLANPLVELESGEALLDYMAALDEGDPLPALVLLDLNMPGIGGLGALEQLRDQPKFSDVPVVIVFTNSDDPREAARSRELGADDFVTKPSDMTGFREFVASLTE